MTSAFLQALASLAAPWVLWACALVVFAAYVLRGATGFGAGVVAIPLLALVMPLTVVVITSYSIHYTKLYDAAQKIIEIVCGDGGNVSGM